MFSVIMIGGQHMTDRGDQKDYSFNDIINFFNGIETQNISLHYLKWRFLKLYAGKYGVDLNRIQEDISYIPGVNGSDEIFKWTSWFVNKYINIRWACPSDLYTDEECYKYTLNDLKTELKNI